MARKLIVEIVGDSKSLERSLGNSTTAVNKFGKETTGVAGKADSAFKKISGGLAGAFVGGVAASAAVNGIKTVVSAASDLNEQITKNQQVFGASSAAVEAWSKTTAQSIGVSETAALEATGTFGNLFTAIGVTGPAAADTSRRLVTLAADLASFNNASPEDTLAAIRSGLVGEAEPLRRYGVLLSEARVAQVAMAETGKDNAKALTVQEKAAARVAIIFKDTTAAQGDFARTSGGLANQQRILAANVSNLEANLGTLLLPTTQKVVGALNDASQGAIVLADGLNKLAHIRIPEITIPFVGTFNGGSMGDLAGKAGGVLKFTPLNPLFGLTIAKAIGDQFRDQASSTAVTTQLANDFADTINTMTTNALTQAGQITSGGPPPGLTGPVLPKGSGAGLKPSDLFGPKITGIPKALQERLLDAELSGKGIRETLVKERDILAGAINDPRNNREDRIKIKTALKGVKDQIAAIDADVAAGIKSANDARTDRLNKAEQAAKDAAAKHKEKLRKIREHQAELAKAAKEAAKTRLQTRQFRAIGLAPEGGDIIPTVANIRKQFAQLTDRIDDSGKPLSSKLAKSFAGVGKLLSGNLGGITVQTREAIKNLFATIRQTFDEESGKTAGPLTRTSSLNSNKILEGLGLDRNTEKELRARLSSFNSAGKSLAGATRPTGQFGSIAGGGDVVVNLTTTLDGQVVAQNTTRHQIAGKRRNPWQKRGPNRGTWGF